MTQMGKGHRYFKFCVDCDQRFLSNSTATLHRKKGHKVVKTLVLE